LTQTRISLHELSHKTQNSIFGQSNEDSSLQILKSPGKNANLEEESHKSVTVTWIKTESLTRRKRPVSGGKPVVTTDSMERDGRCETMLPTLQIFYICYN
jgi:hypothetical protein